NYGGYPQPVRITDVTDGTSNTVMIGERPPDPSWYWGIAGAPDYGDSFGTAQPSWNIIYYADNTYTTTCPPPPHNFGDGPLNINSPCSVNQMWSNHTGGANFALGDGSVRFISYSAAPLIPALATRGEGEVVSVP